MKVLLLLAVATFCWTEVVFPTDRSADSRLSTALLMASTGSTWCVKSQWWKTTKKNGDVLWEYRCVERKP